MKPMPAVPMPLTLGDLRRASRSRDARRRLEEQIARYHGAQAALGVSSGRAALALVLRALRPLKPERETVLLPAYTCPTVGRSVVEAGLQGTCVDVSPASFNIDPIEVADAIDERTLAVVAPHMFGLPCDLEALTGICRDAGVYLIEDCAQCVGGTWAGQRVGTFGDVAFLSMGRSKNLRGYEGGLIWTKREDLVDALQAEFERLPDGVSGVADRLTQAAITVLSRPRPWAMARRLPGLGVGVEDASFDPHPSKLADWQAGLGLISLERVDEYNERRRAVGAMMREALGDIAGLSCQAVPTEAEPTFLRFAARLESADVDCRDTLVERLQAAKIDARAFYSRTLPEWEWWQGPSSAGEGARELVKDNIVLPVPWEIDEAGLDRIRMLIATSRDCSAGE